VGSCGWSITSLLGLDLCQPSPTSLKNPKRRRGELVRLLVGQPVARALGHEGRPVDGGTTDVPPEAVAFEQVT
jgi:hypothetical protein